MNKREALWLHGRIAMGVLALVLVGSVPLATGCGSHTAGQHEQETQASEGNAEKQSEATQDDSALDSASRAEGDAALNVWADECLDRRGDATVYALAELTGGQLEALLLQQDYAWNERNQIWLKQDGSAAVVVLDEKGTPLSSEEVAQLKAGATESKVSYRLVTSGYSSAKKAFEGLASKVLTCIDMEQTESGMVGVLVGPSQHRVLATVSKENNVYVVTVMGEDAIAEGLFDVLAKRELGRTLDDVFLALAGRSLQEQSVPAV